MSHSDSDTDMEDIIEELWGQEENLQIVLDEANYIYADFEKAQQEYDNSELELQMMQELLFEVKMEHLNLVENISLHDNAQSHIDKQDHGNIIKLKQLEKTQQTRKNLFDETVNESENKLSELKLEFSDILPKNIEALEGKMAKAGEEFKEIENTYLKSKNFSDTAKFNRVDKVAMNILLCNLPERDYKSISKKNNELLEKTKLVKQKCEELNNM